MITLLEKTDEDRRFIKNWRPISLMNADVKFAPKAIARRLETILPELIHHNQNRSKGDQFLKQLERSTRTISLNWPK